MQPQSTNTTFRSSTSSAYSNTPQQIQQPPITSSQPLLPLSFIPSPITQPESPVDYFDMPEPQAFPRLVQPYQIRPRIFLSTNPPPRPSIAPSASFSYASYFSLSYHLTSSTTYCPLHLLRLMHHLCHHNHQSSNPSLPTTRSSYSSTSCNYYFISFVYGRII